MTSNGTALNGVTVYITAGDTFTAYTSGYTFRDLPSGTYVIYAELNGYTDASKTVTISCAAAPSGGQQNVSGNGTAANRTVVVNYTKNGTTYSANVTPVSTGPNSETYNVNGATVTVNVGENRTVDVNGDGKPEIYIMLNGISGGVPNYITGAIAEAAAGQGNATQPGANVTQNITPSGGCIAENATCVIDSDCCSNLTCSSGRCMQAQPIISTDIVGEIMRALPQILGALIVVIVVIAGALFLLMRLMRGEKGGYKFKG
jgi:hypothetical protein